MKERVVRAHIARPLPYWRGGERLMVRSVQRHLKIQRRLVIVMMALAAGFLVAVLLAVVTGGAGWAARAAAVLAVVWFSAVMAWIVFIAGAPEADLRTFEDVGDPW